MKLSVVVIVIVLIDSAIIAVSGLLPGPQFLR